MELQVGVIGTGAVAVHHMSAYAACPATRVVALASIDAVRRDAFAAGFEIAKVTDDYRAVLDDKEIDLVDICLPHDLHHRVVLEAVQAGKHIILEKPIALTIEQADEMIDAAERGGRRFFVSLNQRFVPSHRKAKELIDSGVLGKPFLGIGVIIGDEYARMNEPNNWKGTWNRAGGGALADTGTHVVDLMHWYFGEATAVVACVERLVVEAENKADDNACGIIEFESGAVASIVVTYSALGSPWTETKEIVGTKGSIKFTSSGDSPVYHYAGKKSDPRLIEVERVTEWWGSSVQAAVRHLVDCLVNDKVPEVTPHHARRTLKTILALYESARAGKRIELTA